VGFVGNFLRFAAVQKFRKSVKIQESYRQLKGGNFFETQCIIRVFMAAVWNRAGHYIFAP